MSNAQHAETESCHESSALRLVSELGVADIIGDDVKSISDISKETDVDVRYLSEL